MRQMVALGEVDALVAERVWKELERALAEPNPEKFFAVLAACHALPKLFPGITMDGAGIQTLQAAVFLSPQTSVRFAALVHALPHAQSAIATLCKRYRLPNLHRDLATLVAQHYQTALSAQTLSASALLHLFNALDIFRREPRFHHFLLTCQAIANSKNQPFAQEWVLGAANAAKSVDIQILLAQGLTGNTLASQLQEERKRKIAMYHCSTLS
jgi:tRNA nucleotidyltransferase (CCA-adding enzyme)